MVIIFKISVTSVPSLQKDDPTPVADEFKTVLTDPKEEICVNSKENVPSGCGENNTSSNIHKQEIDVEDKVM